MPCPFCELPERRIALDLPLVRVIRDAYPITLGHSLILPKRHVQSYFALTEQELGDMNLALSVTKACLDQELKPDGYNIGINDGYAAGQTIPHVHVHLIPRYIGDAEDPRGGVRWIMPQTARYW